MSPDSRTLHLTIPSRDAIGFQGRDAAMSDELVVRWTLVIVFQQLPLHLLTYYLFHAPFAFASLILFKRT